MRAALLGLALLAACTDWTAPADAVQFTPPPDYAVWWAEASACIGRREWVPYERIRWFVVPERILATDGELHGALTDGTDIYLWERNTGIPWVIQHELAHAIDRLDNTHPADPFDRCGLMGVLP